MEAYAAALTYAIPGFVLLIIIEAIAAYVMGKKINRAMDVISSLSSGVTNTIQNILGLFVIIISYEWMEGKLGIFDIQSTVWLYILAFIGIDFASYWSHRWNHEVNLFWNRHIVHHSSEDFNLSCALRQAVSAIVSIYFFLYIPLAIIGIPPEVIALIAPIHLFAQFWYHTVLIGKMGFLEKILVTPSHHRVHHAINAEYLDKNYAAIFIAWDKWFGTFQEELDDVPAVYGTKKPVNTWNPILINFMHVWGIFKDAWRTRAWWDKIRIWFMPTGWRPADVQEKYPVEVIEDVFARKQYDPPASTFLKLWSWAQLILTNLLLYYSLVKIADFSFLDLLLYCAFLVVTIFAYTSLMDRHPIAVGAEALKLATCLGLVYHMDGWFGMDGLFPGATLLVIAYSAISFILSIYFTYFERVGKLEDERIRG
jgi:sterol desaturase/sphingolipid hydroxylase (fatty acid hydroxylase superfamily)